MLHNVPATLSPFPTFKEVARGFVGRAGEIYPQDGPDAGTRSDAREAAEQAFSESASTSATTAANSPASPPRRRL